MRERRDSNIQWTWQGTIPTAVVVGILQCFGGLFNTYTGSKSTAEVIKRVEDVSHQVELIVAKQNSVEPRFLLIETELKAVKEQIVELKHIKGETK